MAPETRLVLAGPLRSRLLRVARAKHRILVAPPAHFPLTPAAGHQVTVISFTRTHHRA